MTAVYKYRHWLIGGVVFLVMALFIGLSAANGGPGFPLDDGWIHQTYARNLARNGRLEFIPGIVSSGSTSPLWTILLAIGYLLQLPYLLWAYLLGGLSLWLLAWAGMRLWRQLWPNLAQQDWLAGLVLVMTWPLIWAAASGMETLMFAALGLALVSQFTSRQVSKWQVTSNQSPVPSLRSPILLGFLSGLLILIRPDGLVLLLLLGVGLFLGGGTLGQKVKMAALFGGTAVLPLLPYFAFNLWSSGSIWPNTFYAKQIEYATLLAQPLIARLIRLLYFSLGGPENGWRGVSGAHLLLLPGLVTAIYHSFRVDWQKKQLRHLLPLLWAGGHIALYAWRLPVTYQHGRYLLAALPVWILYGLSGWLWLLKQIPNDRIAFISRQVGRLTFGILLIFFLLLGGQSYAQDVAFIEGEMVTVAHWLAKNTQPDDLIAAHDIGAIGYFAERPLLDLAGLITPEIIPYLDDEVKIGRYIQTNQAKYLITAPGWPYHQIINNLSTTQIYTTNFVWTQQNSLNNMTVYQINLP
jgi:hypothetical protein